MPWLLCPLGEGFCVTKFLELWSKKHRPFGRVCLDELLCNIILAWVECTSQTAEGRKPHLRVLNVSLRQRHNKLSGHLVPSVKGCLGSLLQPRAYCGVLMHPLPWAGAQKTAQARQAHLEARGRPPTLYLLPQGIQPQPAQ